ncbi:MAG: hypothetical protein H6739_31215 [Alphaproteobacteria bacterium]|nr:hypothetical protein [Alphaproteobacteria bacterium]
MRRILSPALMLTPLALAGCNQYELFRMSGYEQVSFSNDAEVIFIIDNSSSMQDEAVDLALNFDAFIDNLTSAEGGGLQTDDLADAVRNYIVYTSERGRYIDYQLAITTTSVEIPDTNPDLPGVYGELTGTVPIIQDTDGNVADQFTENLLCESTCWLAASLASDPNYVCGDEPDQITLEYLDCVCGFDEWEGNCGSGSEEPLEAAFMAMCRAVDDPPEQCFESAPFGNADVGTNAGMLREDSTIIFVIVTDEGDYSRRFPSDDGRYETDPKTYLDLLDLFGKRYRIAVVGPNYDYDNNSLTCNSGGATTWAARRLQLAAEATEGFYRPIAEPGAGSECVNSDFAVHLEELGALLQGLQSSFPLQSYPDVETIAVYVDGEFVPASSVDEAATEAAGGETVYTSGWTYDPAENSVAFHGDRVPDYNEIVEIYYKPLEGTPRSLPF